MNCEGSELSLETVTMRTFTVISFEYAPNSEAYETILQVPVGYGCQVAAKQDKEQDDQFKQETEFFWGKLWQKSVLDLEISATKINVRPIQCTSKTIILDNMITSIIDNKKFILQHGLYSTPAESDLRRLTMRDLLGWKARTYRWSSY